MHIALEVDLSKTASMSEIGQLPADNESRTSVSLPLASSQEETRTKKSAFEITKVEDDEVAEEPEDLDNSTVGSFKEPMKAIDTGALSMTPAAVTLAAINGPGHHQLGSRFRRVNVYNKDRWTVQDGLEVDVDERSDTSESRGSIKDSSNTSPVTPRRNGSNAETLPSSSSTLLSNGSSILPNSSSSKGEDTNTTADFSRDEVSTLTHSSRRPSDDTSQGDVTSTDDLCEDTPGQSVRADNSRADSLRSDSSKTDLLKADVDSSEAEVYHQKIGCDEVPGWLSNIGNCFTTIVKENKEYRLKVALLEEEVKVLKQKCLDFEKAMKEAEDTSQPQCT